jgi:phosphoribosylformylglycinamidine synthase
VSLPDGVLAPVESDAYPEGDVQIVRLLDADLADVKQASDEIGWGLSAEELAAIKDRFQQLDRNPTLVEVEALAQGWSEHCCYKTSRPVLREHVFGIEDERVLLREDAGVLEFDDDHVYALRIESHNHPSAIEPYGGAATGVGGILRDITCMGCQPVAVADMLYFGPPSLDEDQLPEGVKHPRFLTEGVVAGIRDYGNRVGIPNLAGSLHFHENYTTNCLVNVGCLGVGAKDDLTRSRSGPPGSIWILAGGRTGRDGIHGVTFASQELDEASQEESVPAVQLGDPITKEPLIHACLECIEEDLVEGMKDLGGGGLSCAVGEMCEAAGVGADLELGEVHCKAEGLSPWEIWVSESQERMMLSVDPEDADAVREVLDAWDVEHVTLGEATEDANVTARWHGEVVFDLDPVFVYEGPEVERPSTEPEAPDLGPAPGAPDAWDKALVRVLEHPNVACRAPLLRQYDHTVRASTVVEPWVGELNADGHADASVVKPLPDSRKGLAWAAGVNPAVTALDPYRGSKGAVDEVVRNLTCVGAVPDALADGLNFPNPEKPEGMGLLEASARGLGEAARAMELPFASGNVSLYNESHAGAVPATPSLLGVGLVEDVTDVTTSDLKGGELVLVGPTTGALGGSVYSRLKDAGGRVPDTDVDRLARTAPIVVDAIRDGLVSAAHDPSEGGLAAALAEMAVGGATGLEVELTQVHPSPEAALFAETPTRWVLETGEPDELVRRFTSEGLTAQAIGATGGDRLVVEHDGRRLATPGLDTVREAWHGGLERALGGSSA